VSPRLHDDAVTPVRHVVYLHGFASSPGSSKAQRFARELGALGVGFSCPDFNEPAFETLTVSRMLAQTRAAVAAAAPPVALIGSSLGAFVALHAAAEMTSGIVSAAAPEMIPDVISRLILLAPALDFGGNRLRQLGEHGIDAWRRAGTLQIFHYAAGAPRNIHFELYADAARYDALALDLRLPALVFQGTHDATVDPDLVRRWASTQPQVDLRLVDDEHQLGASMDEIWRESRKFLGLGEA
jgi:pimeloyl-ACP methyl ester carboxylesterase